MSQVSLNGLTLHVADVERSLEFYRKIPGSTVVVHQVGEFAILRVGRGRLGLLRHDEGRFHIELDTTDLDAIYDRLLQVGLHPESPPAERPWGERDFLVLDPDGNLIEFGIERDARP